MGETNPSPADLLDENHLDPDETPSLEPSQRVIGEPSVIVSNVHITYRVFGGRPSHRMSASARTKMTRVLSRSQGHIGAVTEVPAVRGVSFVARRGESIGIVGTNGSGKTTLLRGIAGLIPFTEGTAYVSSDPTLLGVNAVLINDLTGRQNIMIGGLALGLTPEEVRERTPQIIDFAGIGDFVDLPMMAYSSGMGARLRFAISSLASPDILMIDEALGTGDSTFKAKSKQRFDEILENAGTIFLVSHSAGTIRSMCNRGLWLNKGELVMDGPVDEVCAAYEAYAKSKKVAVAGARLAAKKAAATKAGGVPASMQPTSPASIEKAPTTPTPAPAADPAVQRARR